MEGPDGRVYNLLRLESGWSKSHPIANKAILLRVPDGAFAGEGTGDAPPLVFDSIVDMPGGSCKFTVRRHGPSGVYFALTNNVTNVSACPSARNVLTLGSYPRKLRCAPCLTEVCVAAGDQPRSAAVDDSGDASGDGRGDGGGGYLEVHELLLRGLAVRGTRCAPPFFLP